MTLALCALAPLALAVAGFAACQPSGMHGGAGLVLDTTTEQPVPDAQVTLECVRSTGIHSSETAGFITVSTDAAGRYVFEHGQVSRCHFGFVRVAKIGYVDAAKLGPRFAYTSYDRIPPARYLAPAAEAGMLRLALLDPGPRARLFPAGRLPTEAEARAPPDEPPAHEYDRVFEAFYKAKWIAQPGKETAYVIEHYCQRLQGLNEQIPPADRAARPATLVSYEDVDREPRILHIAPRDHDTEVVPFCRSGGAVKSPYVHRFPASSGCTTILQNPTRVWNHVCRSPVHVILAFNDQGIGVESADIDPGAEYRTRTEGTPRIAECAVGEIAVTARGEPWTGVENAALCRTPAPSGRRS